MASAKTNAGGEISAGARSLPPALFMTDAMRCPDPFSVVRRLPAGDGVILRDYEHPDRQGMAARLAGICRERGLILFIGGDAGLARAVGAHGLHLPQRLVDQFSRDGLRADMLVSVATHSRAEMDRAAQVGADALLLSPLFRTASHPQIEPLGLQRFTELVRESQIPVYALGGLTRQNISHLPKDDKIAGYAGIGIFMNEEGT